MNRYKVSKKTTLRSGKGIVTKFYVTFNKNLMMMEEKTFDLMLKHLKLSQRKRTLNYETS